MCEADLHYGIPSPLICQHLNVWVASQKFYMCLICCWRLFTVSAALATSSANMNANTSSMSLVTEIPGLHLSLRYASISFINKENMIGELTYPYVVPILRSKYLVKPSPTLTQDFNCPYIDLKIHKNLLSSLIPFRSTDSTRDYSIMTWLVVWQCKCGKIICLLSNTTSFFKSYIRAELIVQIFHLGCL